MPTIAALLLMFPFAQASHSGKYFRITVVDQQTGRGVPLVELRTVNNIRYYTDSNGIAAFHEPGLMSHRVFFHVKSHGYEFPKDGFGYRGTALDVTAGGSAVLKIKRINIAERLYRVTGGGIYRDSVLVSHPVPIKEPVLNGLVLGQDSIFTIIHGGMLYWFWGDTGRPGYPLGNFHMSGATSSLPEEGGLDPEAGVDLTYFVDEHGFSKPMAPMPGEGPTWADAFVILREEDGGERMYGAYSKIRPGTMETHERGLMVFNDHKQQFEKVASLPMDAPIYPRAHAFKRKVNGIEYVYFATPYPLARVPATPADYCRLSAYQAFTCLKPGTRLADRQVDRTDDGTARYAWKANTPAVSPSEQNKLIEAGELKPEQALLHLRDRDTGKAVLAHAGSVYRNAYRQRWVMIVCEQFGTSMLGETWYAEADTPLGPWVYATKIVTHDKYSFYNPKQHPMFSKDGGRIIFFEGTYTHTFSGNPDPTPRYDYNQIMYRLDLSDERLRVPVPVYSLSGQDPPNRFATLNHLPSDRRGRPIAFFALDQPGPRTVPVYEWRTGPAPGLLKIATPPSLPADRAPLPVFYALEASIEQQPPTTTPLYEFLHEDGLKRAYSTERSRVVPGYRRSDQPVCLVWRNPLRLAFPLD